MNTITRAERGRKAALTASILAIVAVGLAGCQTGVVDRTTEDQTSVAQQIARSNAASQARYEGLAEHYAQQLDQTGRAADASQARYEGLAEYWQQRARQAEPKRAVAQVPVVADRVERALEQLRARTQVPVVADRLEQAIEHEVATQVPVVADRLEQALEDEPTEVPVVADRLETHE